MLKVLNLYAGLGGNRKLWKNVLVTAVENNEQIAGVYKEENPDDNVIICDAHEYLRKHYSEYDFIWASPPCTKNSKMMKATRHNVANFPDLRLYEEIIFLTHFFKGKWVIENVKPYYEPLIRPSVEIGRHCIWANFLISQFEKKNLNGFITKAKVADTEELKTWLGINYEGNIYYKGNHCPGQVLRNCVHPDIGLHILNCLGGNIKPFNSKQTQLF